LSCSSCYPCGCPRTCLPSIQLFALSLWWRIYLLQRLSSCKRRQLWTLRVLDLSYCSELKTFNCCCTSGGFTVILTNILYHHLILTRTIYSFILGDIPFGIMPILQRHGYRNERTSNASTTQSKTRNAKLGRMMILDTGAVARLPWSGVTETLYFLPDPSRREGSGYETSTHLQRLAAGGHCHAGQMSSLMQQLYWYPSSRTLR
jgi:hypothetical protein